MTTVDRDAIYVSAAGRAIERGLMPERQGNTLLIRYPEGHEATPKEDHLHRQVLRDLVSRLTGKAAKVRTAAIDGGFLMEVHQMEVAAGYGGEADTKPVETVKAEALEAEAPEMDDTWIVERIRELVNAPAEVSA